MRTNGKAVKTVAVAAILLLSAGAAGCAGSDGSKDGGGEESYTVAFSHPSGEAKSVQAVQRFAQERADERGVELLLDSTTAMNLETQRAAVEGWIAQGVDAIVVRPVDPTALAGLQRQAQEAGIHWLTYSTEMDGQEGSVGWSSDAAGELLADDLSSWIDEHPESDKTAAVATLNTVPALSGQWKHPIDVLDEAGVDIVLKQDCVDQACGLQMAEDALRENPDLRIFIAGSTDDVGVGAAQAFAAAGIDPEKVYIGGQDGAEQALVEIKKGTFYKATAAIRLDDLGFSIVDASLAAITGKGKTDLVSPSVLAKTGDTATLDELIGMYQ